MNKRITTNIKQTGRLVCLWLVNILLFAGCSQEEGPASENSERTPVAFNTIIGSRTVSDGNEWSVGDEIGVFMLTAGGSIPGDISANNYKYIISDAAIGTLSSVSGDMYYPESQSVDFVAYYPYGEKGIGSGKIDPDTYRYTVDITNQDDPASLDILYAKVTDAEESNNSVTLPFNHVMSKITLNIKIASGLLVEHVQVSGMPVTGVLDLQDGKVTEYNTTSLSSFYLKEKTLPASGYNTSFNAILIPQGVNEYNDRTVLFIVSGTEYNWKIPDTDDFEAGKNYVYPVIINQDGVSIGEPVITSWNETDHGSGMVESVRLETVFIPAGEFLMGSPVEEPNRGLGSSEVQHRVRLTQGFYMSKYPVTNAQYAYFLNSVGVGWNGTYRGEHLIVDDAFGVIWNSVENKWIPSEGHSDHPVVRVTWYGASAYARWVGGGLPTEAQWEYACRGDKGTLPFGIGNGKYLDGTMANVNGYCVYDYDKGGHQPYDPNGIYLGSTSVVGSYEPNSYGLYDMHGNVDEWCMDWYDEKYGLTDGELNGIVIDPSGPDTGKMRVMRGNCWEDYAHFSRSAGRGAAEIHGTYDTIGFRVVFVP